MNSATFKMYQFTCWQYDCMGWNGKPMNPRHVQQYWLDMLYDLTDCYDCEWYPLIGTPAIHNTIDWNYIVRKYHEKTCIEFKDDN